MQYLIHHPLADAYPRRWKGYNTQCRPGVIHDCTSLQTVATRRGVMSNTGTRPVIIRGKVLSVLPVKQAFTIAEIVTLTGLSHEAVGRLVCTLINDGYPIKRVDRRKPRHYWYEGGHYTGDTDLSISNAGGPTA